MSWDVRTLAPDDAGVLHDVIETVHGTSPGVAHLTPVLADPDVLVIAAFDGEGAPAGLAYGYRSPRVLRQGHGMLMYEIDVVPRLHRRGAGSAMLRRFDAECAARGLENWWLLTDDENAAAMGLYQSLGGERSNSRDVMFTFRTGQASNTVEED